MMKNSSGTPRVIENLSCNAENGQIKWDPVKSIWYNTHLFIALVGCALFFSGSAFLVFIVFTAASLCLGHSLGMHRRLIHKSYQCPLWMDYLFVHLGVLVGLAGHGSEHQIYV